MNSLINSFGNSKSPRVFIISHLFPSPQLDWGWKPGLLTLSLYPTSSPRTCPAIKTQECQGPRWHAIRVPANKGTDGSAKWWNQVPATVMAISIPHKIITSSLLGRLDRVRGKVNLSFTALSLQAVVSQVKRPLLNDSLQDPFSHDRITSSSLSGKVYLEPTCQWGTRMEGII